MEPSEVWSVMGGYCLLQQSSVVAAFAQTSIVIALLITVNYYDDNLFV